MTYNATDYKNSNRYDGEYQLSQRFTFAILLHETQTLTDF